MQINKFHFQVHPLWWLIAWCRRPLKAWCRWHQATSQHNDYKQPPTTNYHHLPITTTHLWSSAYPRSLNAGGHFLICICFLLSESPPSIACGRLMTSSTILLHNMHFFFVPTVVILCILWQLLVQKIRGLCLIFSFVSSAYCAGHTTHLEQCLSSLAKYRETFFYMHLFFSFQIVHMHLKQRIGLCLIISFVTSVYCAGHPCRSEYYHSPLITTGLSSSHQSLKVSLRSQHPVVIPQNICIPLITLGIGTWKSREDYTNHISYDNLIIIVSIPDILPGTVRVGNDRYVLRVDRKGDECQGYHDNCWYKKEGKAAQ